MGARFLPSTGVILAKTSIEVVVGVAHIIVAIAHIRRLWLLLEILNVLGRVASLQGGEVTGTLVLAFPQEVLS